MCEKKIPCPCRNLLLLVARLGHRLAIHLLQETVNEESEVPRSLPKRRDVQDSHGEAIEEVLAEAATGDLLGQGPIGGGNDPDVDLQRLGGTQPDHLTLLNHSEQFYLSGRREFTDFCVWARRGRPGRPIAGVTLTSRAAGERRPV